MMSFSSKLGWLAAAAQSKRRETSPVTLLEPWLVLSDAARR